MKGHADDHAPFEELTRPQQLNVLADALATQQRDVITGTSFIGPKAAHLPPHTARLYVGGKLQTGKEKQTTLYRWAEHRHKTYLCDKYDWTEDTYNNINWDAIRYARRKLTDSELRFAIKHSIKWLPLNQRTYNYMNGPTPACLACGQDETPEHLYQCMQREALNQQLIDDIRQTLYRENTPTDLKLHIIINIEDEIKNTPQKDRLSQHQCQGKLGATLTWQDFLAGRIDKRYGEEMETFYKNEGDSRRTGTAWTSALLVSIWKGLYKIWKARCDKQHQSDKDTVGSYARLDAQAVTKAMYAQTDKIRQFDRDKFFSEPLETLLEKPTRYIKAWIQTVKPILKQLIKDAIEIDTNRMRDLREYFLVRRPP